MVNDAASRHYVPILDHTVAPGGTRQRRYGTEQKFAGLPNPECDPQLVWPKHTPHTRNEIRRGLRKARDDMWWEIYGYHRPRVSGVCREWHPTAEDLGLTPRAVEKLAGRRRGKCHSGPTPQAPGWVVVG